MAEDNKNWLFEDMKRAKKNIEQWPQWMRDTAHFEGSDVPEYWKPKRDRD